MNPQTRKLLIQRLIPAIGVIGPDFEKFGSLVLDHILSTPMEHTGLNRLGFPISRVVDSSSPDGKVVAEYSAKHDYFSTGMEKAREDIQHALQRQPNAKSILLLSSQPDRRQIIEDFRSEILATPQMKGRSLSVWGAERIAEHIVDRAARDRLFPVPSSRHTPRPALYDEIARRLTAAACVTIGGIAGCGKSDAAAAFGITCRDKYDLRIWLDRDEIARAEDLYATPLVRGSERRNIASLMKTRRCLLVIDDPGNALESEKLAELCGPGSHVLLTMREVGAGVYRLPDLSMSEARAILTDGNPEACPDLVFDKIWTAVGGHPLSLALMNGAWREGASWTDIEVDCQMVGSLPDRAQRLADRLLLRNKSVLRPALAVFEWAGQPDCDAGFLRHVIQPHGVRNLVSHALTAADRGSTVRLHDVIFSSLPSLDWWSPSERAELDVKLAGYLESTIESNDLSFWSAAGSLRNRLQALIRHGNHRSAYLLALIAAVNPECIDICLLGDPVAKAATLAELGQPIARIEFKLLIESFEWLYLRYKSIGPDKAHAFAESGLPLFDYLSTLPALTNLQVAEIAHHRGKTLGRLQRPEAARREYESVMAGPSPLDATRVQLIRSYKATKEFDAAARLGEEVLTSAERTGNVAPSVLLAVIHDLPWQEPSVRQQVLVPRQSFIEDSIVGFANASYDQAYTTLAAVARFWSIEAPDALRRVMGKIPLLSTDELKDDESRFSFGDILFEYSRSIETNAAATQKLALSFYEAEVNPKPFHLQRRAELLIAMSRPVEAESILRTRDDLSTNCWVQRLIATARFDQGDAADALLWIDRALRGEKCVNKYFEFHELRFRIRRALGDSQAPDDLLEAINLAPDGPQRERLRSRMELGD